MKLLFGHLIASVESESFNIVLII